MRRPSSAPLAPTAHRHTTARLLFAVTVALAATAGRTSAEARAAQTDAAQTDPPVAAPAPAAEAGVPVALPFLLPSSVPGGQGFAIGFENGLFGDGFGQGLRLRLPFGQHWGVVLRALSVMDEGAPDRFDWSLGGRVEVFGQSPVFLNLVRMYGGGGPQFFRGMRGGRQGESGWGGGGQFGFEFFQSPRVSYFLEVGGQGGERQVSGATVLAGMNIYPVR